MKAILCTAYGPPEVLRLGELPTPAPKRGQVRIRMHATAVTYSDCLVRGLAVRPFIRLVARLILGYHRPRRQVLGIVVAGEIDRVGAGVKTWREGDPVFGMDGWGARANAEYKCMKANGLLVSKPANRDSPGRHRPVLPARRDGRGASLRGDPAQAGKRRDRRALTAPIGAGGRPCFLDDSVNRREICL